MSIRYETTRVIGEEEFVDLLKRSTLAERRPVDDPKCIKAMLAHADLVDHFDVERRKHVPLRGQVLQRPANVVGAQEIEYCCYLSDLAVDAAYQKQGIGRELIRLTQSRLGSKAKIILLAAPKAEGYYARIGFDAHRSAWIISATESLK